MGSVNTPTWGSKEVKMERTGSNEKYLARFHVLEIHADLAGDAFSEPEVGCGDLEGLSCTGRVCCESLTHLEGVLFLYGMDWGSKLSELAKCGYGVGMGRAAMAGTGGVLCGEVDETEDRCPRRGGHR